MNSLNVAKIQLNGDSYEINNGTNLNQLLNKLKIQKKGCCRSKWTNYRERKLSKNNFK